MTGRRNAVRVAAIAAVSSWMVLAPGPAAGQRAAPRQDPAPGTADDRPVGGAAGPRDSGPHPPSHRGGVVVVPGGYGGYYPWGYAGFGFGGYYPWGYAGLGLWGGYYGPWYGYPVPYYQRRDEGRLRLKIKPSEASVYVDGYYAGRVGDFDGTFQSLPLEPGPYRIEIRADGYAPYFFDVRVLPDRTLTFTAALAPVP